MTFTFKPLPGGRIRADHATAAGEPHVWLSVTNTRGEHAAVFIPLDKLEEVIAGIRDMTRQAGPAAPAVAGAPITAEQLAWARENLPQGARITAEALRGMPLTEAELAAGQADVDFLEAEFGPDEPWPSRERWRVESLDPGSGEWAPGSSLITRTAAVIKLNHLAKTAPFWRHDGSPVRRRIVRETTTYTVEEP